MRIVIPIFAISYTCHVHSIIYHILTSRSTTWPELHPLLNSTKIDFAVRFSDISDRTLLRDVHTTHTIGMPTKYEILDIKIRSVISPKDCNPLLAYSLPAFKLWRAIELLPRTPTNRTWLTKLTTQGAAQSTISTDPTRMRRDYNTTVRHLHSYPQCSLKPR
jgi:hypothetical protein